MEIVTLQKASFSKNWILASSCLGEAIELAREKMDQKNVYFRNPSFDKKP